MGNQITLKAGDLQVQVSSDNESLSNVANCAHNEMRWLQEQWTTLDGEMVDLKPSEFEFR